MYTAVQNSQRWQGKRSAACSHTILQSAAPAFVLQAAPDVIAYLIFRLVAWLGTRSNGSITSTNSLYFSPISTETDGRVEGTPSWYLTSHSGQLSLLSSSDEKWVKISTEQEAVAVLCGREDNRRGQKWSSFGVRENTSALVNFFSIFRKWVNLFTLMDKTSAGR